MALYSSGCASDAEKVVDETVSIAGKMARILEENAEKPEAAAEAIKLFVEKNGARMAELAERGRNAAAQLSPAQRAVLLHRFEDRMRPIDERMNRLIEVFGNNQEFQSAVRAVAQSLAGGG